MFVRIHQQNAGVAALQTHATDRSRRRFRSPAAEAGPATCGLLCNKIHMVLRRAQKRDKGGAGNVTAGSTAGVHDVGTGRHGAVVAVGEPFVG